MKKYVIDMLVQLISVTMGVFLGMKASNWNEEKIQLTQQKEFLKIYTNQVSIVR